MNSNELAQVLKNLPPPNEGHLIESSQKPTLASNNPFHTYSYAHSKSRWTTQIPLFHNSYLKSNSLKYHKLYRFHSHLNIHFNERPFKLSPLEFKKINFTTATPKKIKTTGILPPEKMFINNNNSFETSPPPKRFVNPVSNDAVLNGLLQREQTAVPNICISSSTLQALITLGIAKKISFPVIVKVHNLNGKNVKIVYIDKQLFKKNKEEKEKTLYKKAFKKYFFQKFTKPDSQQQPQIGPSIWYTTQSIGDLTLLIRFNMEGTFGNKIYFGCKVKVDMDTSLRSKQKKFVGGVQGEELLSAIERMRFWIYNTIRPDGFTIELGVIRSSESLLTSIHHIRKQDIITSGNWIKPHNERLFEILSSLNRLEPGNYFIRSDTKKGHHVFKSTESDGGNDDDGDDENDFDLTEFLATGDGDLLKQERNAPVFRLEKPSISYGVKDEEDGDEEGEILE